MKEAAELIRDGVKVDVRFAKGALTVGGDTIVPERASLDAERRTPFWKTMVYLILILAGGILLAVALLDTVVASAVVMMAAIGLCVFVHLATGRMDEVLLVEHEDGVLKLRGDERTLHELYYQLTKATMRNRREEGTSVEEGEGRAGKKAGVFRSGQVLSAEDEDAIRKDLEKGVIKKRRIRSTICPDCGSDELYYESGLLSGYIYHCKRCDYVGAFVIEKELDFKDDGAENRKGQVGKDRADHGDDRPGSR